MPSLFRFRFPHIAYLLLVLALVKLQGHPIPDIPVIGHFETNGSALLEVEIDPRCFAEDPEEVPYLQYWVLQEMDQSEKEELRAKAAKLVSDSLRCRFEPGGWFSPDFVFGFEKKGGEPLLDIDDTVVLRGKWGTVISPSTSGYQVRAFDQSGFDIVFTNRFGGIAHKQVHVLFPGEESFLLNLKGLVVEKAEESSAPVESSTYKDDDVGPGTFSTYLRKGFVHVVPLGLDHILFVLGLFLLSRKWKPLLLQVTMFTLAHTITLGLATTGVVSANPAVVEPIIAASIAVVALENIFLPGYKPYRLAIVFIFGLIHGLGFAGALGDYDLQPASLIAGLLGFNVGVEFGQVAVIGLAFLATFYVRKEEVYRKWVVVPGSSVIALMGVYWTIERVFF